MDAFVVVRRLDLRRSMAFSERAPGSPMLQLNRMVHSGMLLSVAIESVTLRVSSNSNRDKWVLLLNMRWDDPGLIALKIPPRMP